MVKALNNYVLVEVSKETENKTQSGLHLPGKGDDRISRGIVISVGPGDISNGVRVPVCVSKGDKVIFSNTRSIEVSTNEGDFVLVVEPDLLCVVS